VVSDDPQDPSIYKARLKGLKGLLHVTVEAHTCANHEHRHELLQPAG
jgi:hypothetical protein